MGGAISAAAPASPTLLSAALPTVPVGLEIFDNANLLGGSNPTGTLTFLLFGPGDVTCATPIFTSTVPVAPGGSTSSQHLVTTLAGTYRWTVSYSGDVNNNPAGPTPCANSAATTIVTRAGALVTTAASSAGATVHDVATLGGGFNPTGTITFQLAGPGDVFCSAAPVFTSTVPVNGNGTYDSGPFTAIVSGTYKFQASYSGDVNNVFSSTPCLDPAESVVVAAPPLVSLTTTASPAVVVGATINDTATLTGGTNPTGTVTFSLFGPDNATCTGTPAFTSTKTAAATTTSAPFVPTAPGVYRWVASYSGDANNAGVTTACNAPNESVTVSAVPPARPTIATTASPSVLVGDGIHDTALLGGGSSPTGTITFRLFDGTDATCTTTPAFVSTVTVDKGAGAYDSATFLPTSPGAFRWTADYSGDATNAPATSACTDPNELVFVSALPTPIIITRASAGVTIGGQIHDTAILASELVLGEVPATGTLT